MYILFMYPTRYSCQILIKTEFSNAFRKTLKYPNFIKIRSLGVQLFNADGHTDKHDEAHSRFSQLSARTYNSPVYVLRNAEF